MVATALGRLLFRRNNLVKNYRGAVDHAVICHALPNDNNTRAIGENPAPFRHQRGTLHRISGGKIDRRTLIDRDVLHDIAGHWRGGRIAGLAHNLLKCVKIAALCGQPNRAGGLWIAHHFISLLTLSLTKDRCQA